MKNIIDTLEHLCSIEPGYVWTEYDWRMVLQLKQEVESMTRQRSYNVTNLVEKLLKSPLSSDQLELVSLISLNTPKVALKRGDELLALYTICAHVIKQNKKIVIVCRSNEEMFIRETIIESIRTISTSTRFLRVTKDEILLDNLSCILLKRDSTRSLVGIYADVIFFFSKADINDEELIRSLVCVDKNNGKIIFLM